MSLIDSDVLIEAQRGTQAARTWLNGFDGQIALPAAVAWELLTGSRDARELRLARKFLSTFDVEEIQPADSLLARSLIEDHALSTGLSIPDYLIAAQALNRETTLYTFNLRHYRSIPGLDARSPYER